MTRTIDARVLNNSGFLATATGSLQRKCKCGSSAKLDGMCSHCAEKETVLQRDATSDHIAGEVPQIVYDVLRSPGQPIDAATRKYIEPKFGYDFSRVRVHTDGLAAKSAAMVNASAYTVGSNIVFGYQEYNPSSLSGRELIAHELVHAFQQRNVSSISEGSLHIDSPDSREERSAESSASRIVSIESAATSIDQGTSGINVQRSAIHTGRILDEGDCAHLACNSKWACKDNANGVKCPEGTRNASDTDKFRPLFTCDTKCENNQTCDDSGTWMAIPNSRFKRSKCGQDLVICANGRFVHGQVRDRSEVEAWEVSHGIQDDLDVSPYATFQGAVYSDESDASFKKDGKCHPKPEKQSDKDKKAAESVIDNADATMLVATYMQEGESI